MRKTIFALLFVATTALTAQDIIYHSNDSTTIMQLLHKYKSCNIPNGKRAIAIASEFLGNRYVAGTLDKASSEPLIIHTQQLDCTTFVELIAAIYATTKEGKEDFTAFCANLERIRYRGGKRNGYASRLHYITQWIADSAKQNIIGEIGYGTLGKKQTANLSYMSKHPANYIQLKEDCSLIEEIAKWEQQINGTEISYIPKERVNIAADKLPIEEGDIIALTTNIDGLDVVHLGFAWWKNNQLHLLHASSAAGKVIKDSKSLHEYQKSKKSQTGIRVFRLK